MKKNIRFLKKKLNNKQALFSIILAVLLVVSLVVVLNYKLKTSPRARGIDGDNTLYAGGGAEGGRSNFTYLEKDSRGIVTFYCTAKYCYDTNGRADKFEKKTIVKRMNHYVTLQKNGLSSSIAKYIELRTKNNKW